MDLQHPFYRLPFCFDVERLRAEIGTLPEDWWRRDYRDYKGLSTIPLVADAAADSDGSVGPTPYLNRLPYCRQVLAAFEMVVSKAQLMRLDAGCSQPPQVQLTPYWQHRAQVHVPIATEPSVRFQCGGQSVHMAAGESWTFSGRFMHLIANMARGDCVHLTLDIRGDAQFWAGARPHTLPISAATKVAGGASDLRCEMHDPAPVMEPAKLDMLIARFLDAVDAFPNNEKTIVTGLQRVLLMFCDEWRALWSAAESSAPAIQPFEAARQRVKGALSSLAVGRLRLAGNGAPAGMMLSAILQALVSAAAARRDAMLPHFERPVFIVAAPRSGSTLLFETLSAAEPFWTLGDEGQGHVETIRGLGPQSTGPQSNRLTAGQATEEVRAQLLGNYVSDLRDVSQIPWMDLKAPAAIRFLEKTPKNALRIPFFKAIFPDAKFIFLHREAKANISAIIDAWQSGRFVTYPNLSGWRGLPWSLLLIPAWRELRGEEIGQIAVRQWRDTNEIILNDLMNLPDSDWCSISYEEVLHDPTDALARLCRFADVNVGRRLQSLLAAPLRPSRYTLTRPDPRKWLRNEGVFGPFLTQARDVLDRLAALRSVQG